MKQTSNSKGGILMGAALVAAVAAVAGSYFLYGSKNAERNRKKVKAWALFAKGEILEKLEKLADVSEQAYYELVDQVADKYQTAKHIDKEEVAAFARELKSHWKHMVKNAQKAAKKSTR